MPDHRLTVPLQIIGARRARFTQTITGRAVLVGCAVALVSVLVTALVALPVTLSAGQRQARQALAAEANLAAAGVRNRLDRAVGTLQGERILAQLRRQGIDVYLIRDGQPDRAGLPDSVVRDVAAGERVSRRARVDGQLSIVEGRPLAAGDGLVLVRPAATGAAWLLVRSLWLPLLAGLGGGVLAGTLMARRLSRPIRNAAVAAVRLRAGDRAVRVPAEPPAEVEELAHALNGLAAALATSEGRQREFLLSVSHELRTPLTTIKGYAEALSDGVVEPDGTQRIGQTMLAEAARLDRLVTDLLTLARLEAAEFPVELSIVDVKELVRAAAEAWGPRYAGDGVVLRTELPEGPVLAYTDPGRVRQVVDGLLENALRVVPPGAPVVICVYRTEYAVLEVRDGGPGLADEDLAVAFERGVLYQRYRGVRKVGSGLGLALAARLVRRLGGRIEAGHAPEGGARFTVRLPADASSLPINLS
jgi:two-component system sensor histidine kinase BaeS